VLSLKRDLTEVCAPKHSKCIKVYVQKVNKWILHVIVYHKIPLKIKILSN